MRPISLRCSRIVEMVTDYLEGVLPPAVHAAVERHLTTCAGCAAYVAQFRSTIRLVALLRPA